jgi:two-component system response regulator YesN
MKKVWFQRMIWSYIPVFMIVVCFLFFVFFQTLAEQNKKDSSMANQVFTQQVLYFIDATLQSIDHLMINELLNNEWFQQFFEETEASNVLLNYKIADKIKNLKQMNPLIDSIYLVRYQDQFIFNGNILNGRESFPDTPFIQRMKSEAYPMNWSNLRGFREFTSMDSKRVVSLIRQSPSNVEKGVLVVNVSTMQLQKKIAEMYNPSFRFVSLYDRKGELLFGDDHRAAQQSENNQIVSAVSSVYTGWEIRSGLMAGTLIRVASSVSSFWIVLGMIAFTLGIVSIFYVTRKNYKPIDELLSRIHAYSQPIKPIVNGNRIDEFTLIGAALGNLMEQSSRIAQQVEDELRVRKKFFFHELIGGAHKINLHEWSTQMRSFRMEDTFQFQLVVVSEIDRSADFFLAYSEQDQYLIKFVIASAFQEVMDSHSIPIWMEWTTDHQLSAIVSLNNQQDAAGSLVYSACEHIQQWLQSNLKYTVTMALGTIAKQPAHIALSYKAALGLLQYKAVLGNNRLIQQTDLQLDTQGDRFKYVQLLLTMVESLGIHEEKWFQTLEALFFEMKKDMLSREFILIVLNDLICSLNKALQKMPKACCSCWEEGELLQIQHAMESFETLEEVQRQLIDVLNGLFQRVQAFHSHTNIRDLLRELKHYIELNFMNPELSLEHLGQQFRMNAKYVSHLFKEEFGEKFIDFLTQIRIRQAQQWLAETDWPIQDISEKVGYVNSISFRRVFKKHIGISPGEYRKVKAGLR